jgi:hypothetical protein
MTEQELEKMSATDYLKWELFKTDYDNLPKNKEYATAQYLKGLRTGKEYQLITIGTSGVWSADSNDGKISVQSYERIGYHACTKDLLHGFIDSNCKIQVFRAKFINNNWTIQSTIIN